MDGGRTPAANADVEANGTGAASDGSGEPDDVTDVEADGTGAASDGSFQSDDGPAETNDGDCAGASRDRSKSPDTESPDTVTLNAALSVNNDNVGADTSSKASSCTSSEQTEEPLDVAPFVLEDDLLLSRQDPPVETQLPSAGLSSGLEERAHPGAVGLPPSQSPPMPFKCVEHLYAYLLLRGQCNGTEELYDVVRAGMNISSPVALPTVNTIRYNYSPVVDATWMLPTRTCLTRHRHTGASVSVRYIAPSDHVRRDMLFDSTFKLFKKADERSDRERELHPEFVDSPMFQDRASVLLSGRLVPRFVLSGVLLAVGDRISASIVGGGLLDDLSVKRAFFAGATTGLERSEAAHAGDFIVECDRVAAEPEAAGYLVSRHWCAASLSPLTWHAPGSTVVHVLALNRIHSAGEPPGGVVDSDTPDLEPSSQPGSSAARRLMWSEVAGEMSVVVSVCLYSDDFGARPGKEISLGGVYMSYLSWLFQDRCSSHATRTISITPSGVDSDCILEAITEDLRVGAREGWLCRCADGAVVRVWADVGFFVGDYLQVAKTSNLMGPSANTPCTLCAYRLHGAPGCRFGLAGSSMSAELMRTTGRTGSVCVAASALSADEDVQ